MLSPPCLWTTAITKEGARAEVGEEQPLSEAGWCRGSLHPLRAGEESQHSPTRLLCSWRWWACSERAPRGCSPRTPSLF